MDRLRRLTIPTKFWGDLLVLRSLPHGEDVWGDFAILRGTEWEELLPVVPGDKFSHALHGHAKPLLDVLGPPPHVLHKRLPTKLQWCRLKQAKECNIATEKCLPSLDVPECYEAPVEDIELRMITTLVAQAWGEGRYVIVVGPGEFVI